MPEQLQQLPPPMQPSPTLLQQPLPPAAMPRPPSAPQQQQLLQPALPGRAAVRAPRVHCVAAQHTATSLPLPVIVAAAHVLPCAVTPPAELLPPHVPAGTPCTRDAVATALAPPHCPCALARTNAVQCTCAGCTVPKPRRRRCSASHGPVALHGSGEPPVALFQLQCSSAAAALPLPAAEPLTAPQLPRQATACTLSGHCTAATASEPPDRSIASA